MFVHVPAPVVSESQACVLNMRALRRLSFVWFFFRLLSSAIAFNQIGQEKGTIINFKPPDLNDLLNVTVDKTKVMARSKSGTLVTDRKLDKFSLSVEHYCYESDQLQATVNSQAECPGGGYTLARVRYGDRDLDCLRVATLRKGVVLASMRAVVIKRFHLKVYYRMTDGRCYLKYFELPVYECREEGHHVVPDELCKEVFGFTFRWPEQKEPSVRRV